MPPFEALHFSFKGSDTIILVMKKNWLGVVEGFFGPQWPQEKRKSYAGFLASCGADFYIYAPKQDPHLRKAWRENWDDDYLAHLEDLKSHFQSQGIQFGVGFSPFGLGTTLSEEDRIHLTKKMEILNSIGVDLLGLFFDDMPITDGLAATQIETLEIIRKDFQHKIVFCPSFYTPDPILEKVFGKMPEGYLEDIADGVPLDVSIAWTGPKVISPSIDEEHLKGVQALLKRRPFIWENLFANDGPRNCKFLKLKPFTGRDEASFRATEAFGFNMMNQAELSKFTFLASQYVLEGKFNPEDAFVEAVTKLATSEFKDFILKYRLDFLEKGLDNLPQDFKDARIEELKKFKDPGAWEISDWLQGNFVVGAECLTD